MNPDSALEQQISRLEDATNNLAVGLAAVVDEHHRLIGNGRADHPLPAVSLRWQVNRALAVISQTLWPDVETDVIERDRCDRFMRVAYEAFGDPDERYETGTRPDDLVNERPLEELTMDERRWRSARQVLASADHPLDMTEILQAMRERGDDDLLKVDDEPGSSTSMRQLLMPHVESGELTLGDATPRSFERWSVSSRRRMS